MLAPWINALFGPGGQGTTFSCATFATGERGVIEMDQGMFPAIRRFPTRQSAIEELALGDESFQSLCVDFGEAEAAWQRWEASQSPQRLQRQAEYGELVEGLAGEIEAALDAAATLRRT